MTEPELLELFRRALRSSLAVPLLAGMASCSSSSSATPDAARPDTGANADSGRTDSGKKKDAFTADSGRDAAPVDAVHEVSVARDSAKGDAGVDSGKHDDAKGDSRQADSGKKDAERHDAGRDAPPDAPDLCKISPPNDCPAVLPLTCFDGGLSADAGFLTLAQCEQYCGPASSECSLVPAFNGGVGYSNPNSLDCLGSSCGNGRAYANMARPTAPGQRSPLGRYFAESAQLEAASVAAFRILSGELEAHAAPPELVAAAQAAARDEVRHARVTRRLARRYGRVVPHRRPSPRPVRALEAVASENAVEGCVRETYGALLAHHQAAAATDPDVRATMTRIAVDETRHAALAWKVAAWADARLDFEARGRIALARAAAVAELREAWTGRVPAPLTEVAGLPTAEAARRMLAVLEEALWTA